MYLHMFSDLPLDTAYNAVGSGPPYTDMQVCAMPDWFLAVLSKAGHSHTVTDSVDDIGL